jgi:CRP-like cAMP-binding protein
VAESRRQLELAAGEVFGEMALISSQLRSADVTALDYSTFAMLSGRDFRQLLRKYPESRAQIVRLAAQREERDRRVLVDDLSPGASQPS